MASTIGALERLVGFVMPEAVGLKAAESRSSISFVVVLIVAWSLKYAPCVTRFATWLAQSERDDILRDSIPSPSTAAAPPPAYEAQLSHKDSEVKNVNSELESAAELCGEAISPPISPQLQSSVFQFEDSCIETPDNVEVVRVAFKPCDSDDDMQDGQQAYDSFDLPCGLDDLWGPSGEFLYDTQAAVTSDANSVLETALASGDSKAADAALGAGVRLCGSAWLTKACGQLQAAGIPLMLERALDIIRVFGRERRADLAVDLWEASCEELGLDPADGEDSDPPPAAELYGAALEACARAGDFETAARAAGSTGWRVPLCRHGQAAFLALARWFARRQDVGQAIVCYQAVREITGDADLATHRAVLIASVRSADMAKADALFQDLVASGITPDGATFSAMICGHCSAGNVDKAMHYFHILQSRGIVPTAPLFDAILDGCAWMNMPALMEQVLADMEASGIRPSTTTLSILMRLHGINRDTEQALSLFDELPKKHGLKLDGQAYGTLITVCLKNDVYDMAWNAFGRMCASSLTAHARIYESLIAASLRRGYLDNAVEIVDEALGLSNEQNDEQAMPLSRVRLQPKTIEDMLCLIGRRRQSGRLGVPLAERLVAVGVEISESVVESLRRSATVENEISCSELHRRRAQRDAWRSFPECQFIGVM
jgi:pentatricopeptide repeat protein